MFTEKEKNLLKQAIDIANSNVSNMIIKSQSEVERKALREMNNEYFLLIGKIDSIKKNEKDATKN